MAAHLFVLELTFPNDVLSHLPFNRFLDDQRALTFVLLICLICRPNICLFLPVFSDGTSSSNILEFKSCHLLDSVECRGWTHNLFTLLHLSLILKYSILELSVIDDPHLLTYTFVNQCIPILFWCFFCNLRSFFFFWDVFRWNLTISLAFLGLMVVARWGTSWFTLKLRRHWKQLALLIYAMGLS